MRIRVGIIASSNGSALRAAVELARSAAIEVELTVVSDRDCGLGQWARRSGFQTTRIDYKNAHEFSAAAMTVFQERNCDDVLLFYTRRVADPLISQFRVCNIHPSLLPNFPGLHAVHDAVKARARNVGATLHEVDAGLDTGRVLAQVSCRLQASASLAQAERLSYMQKVYLTLAWFDGLVAGSLHVTPAISPKLGDAISNTTVCLANRLLVTAYASWAETITTSGMIAA
ncbi:MAG: formyltransferase family protein [Gemmatimonadaceae bacterium]